MTKKTVAFSADEDSHNEISELAEELETSASAVYRQVVQLGLSAFKAKLSSGNPDLLLDEAEDKSFLGRFLITGDPMQLQRCQGACGKTKHFKTFPTDDGGAASMRRVAECRECRDRRLGRK